MIFWFRYSWLFHNFFIGRCGRRREESTRRPFVRHMRAGYMRRLMSLGSFETTPSALFLAALFCLAPKKIGA